MTGPEILAALAAKGLPVGDAFTAISPNGVELIGVEFLKPHRFVLALPADQARTELFQAGYWKVSESPPDVPKMQPVWLQVGRPH